MSQLPRRRHPALGTLVLFAAATGGCHGCRDDHPYVPYSIDSSEPVRAEPAPDAASSAVAIAPAGEAGAPFAGEPAVVAPPGLSKWPLGGLLLQAPDGQVFVAAAVRDFDGDGAADAFAVTRPPQGNDPGVLVFYRGAKPPSPEVALLPQDTFAPPATLGREGPCAPIGRLFVAGRRAAFVELGLPCSAHPTSAPDRWVAVVTGGAPARVRLAATIVDPPGAPALSVDADTSDRDHDGLDDVTLRVALEGGSAPLEPGPRVTTTIAWLDRPAGPSRDAAATEASFATLAATAASRAKSGKDAPGVAGLVAQTRALWGAVCADGGAPRLVGVTGTGTITCGSTRALEDAGLAEVRAWATLGDGLRAALTLDRAERAPASRTPTRVTEARGWIAQAAPVATARSVRAVAAVPLLGRGHEPSWGALAFEPGGKLLVRTRAGVARVEPEAGDESSADGVTAWRPGVSSPDGSARWIESYDACDGVALRATFEAGDDIRDVGLPVAPPLGVRCAGSRGAPAKQLPVAWGPSGLEAIVDGVPVLVAPDLAHASMLATFLGGAATAQGSPRSPDGKTLVVPTSIGLVVRGPSRTRLLVASELDGTYGDQRDCTVANDGAHVACVRGGKAWVGAWDAP
jgi:hypothetical protein